MHVERERRDKKGIDEKKKGEKSERKQRQASISKTLLAINSGSLYFSRFYHRPVI